MLLYDLLAIGLFTYTAKRNQILHLNSMTTSKDEVNDCLLILLKKSDFPIRLNWIHHCYFLHILKVLRHY